MAHLLLDGTSGNHASSPTAAVLNIPGDIDLVFDADFDWTTLSTATGLLARWGLTGVAWELQRRSHGSGSRLGLLMRDSGGTQRTFSSAVPVTHGNGRGVVRAFLDADNGSGGSAVSFYEKATWTTGSWTLLDTITVATTSGAVATGSVPVTVGTPDGTNRMLNGKVFRAQIWSGNSESGGTLVFDADFSDPTTWTYA